MGLFGAMTASVAGLGVQGQTLSVISDNLANTNTTGYKASRSLFSQMVTSSGVNGSSYNAGGVGMNVQADQTAQGSLTTTSSNTDLAISGNGFFKVGSAKVNDSSTTFYYTRAGSFTENKEGYLVNPDGYYLQGWKTDSDGTILNIQDPQPIELQSVGVSAQGTTEMSVDANLTGTTTANDNYNTAASLKASLDTILANASTEADFTTDIRVYDQQGNARDLTVAFSKRSDNIWDWQIYTDGANVQGGTSGQNTRVGAGELRFTTKGALEYATTYTDLSTGTATTAGANLNVTWAGGAGTSSIAVNFGDYKGGNVITSTTGALGYTNGVLDIASEDPSILTAAPTTYTLFATAAGTYELRDAGGAALTPASSSVTIGASGNREIYFADRGVRINVTDTFDETTLGAVGTFTVRNVAQKDKGLGTDGITQLGAAFNTSGTSQNGYGAGTLSSISIDGDGFVNGTFTNGEVKKLYKVALAVFQNPSGLETVSGTLLKATDVSGSALLKQAGVGGTGKIVGGSLEGSTSDIATEFSNMIVAQRAFQANSKVISTVNQMLNDLLQIS
jgi:flagellar hook protein FlgE